MTDYDNITDHAYTYHTPRPNLFLVAVFLVISFVLGFTLSENQKKPAHLVTSQTQLKAISDTEDWHGNVKRSTPQQ